LIYNLIRIIEELDFNAIKMGHITFYSISALSFENLNYPLIEFCNDDKTFKFGLHGKLCGANIFVDQKNLFLFDSIRFSKSTLSDPDLINWSVPIPISYLKKDFDINIIKRLLKLGAFY
jgi:hypothetical protein